MLKAFSFFLFLSPFFAFFFIPSAPPGFLPSPSPLPPQSKIGAFLSLRPPLVGSAKPAPSPQRGEGPEGQSKKEAKPPPSEKKMEDKGGGEGRGGAGSPIPSPPPIFDWGNQRLGESKIGEKDGGRRPTPSPSFPALPLFCFAKKAPIKDWVLFIPSAPTGGVFFAKQKRGRAKKREDKGGKGPEGQSKKEAKPPPYPFRGVLPPNQRLGPFYPFGPH